MPEHPKILLVEDDSDDAFLTKRALEKAGVSLGVIHLHDGEEAIKYLSGDAPYADRNKHPLPALVLLDLKMPKMDGFDVLAWIQNRAELASLPVVVLTGSVHPKDISAAKNLGAAGYQIKPVQFSALVEIIESIASGRLLDLKPGFH
jgi:CheY-like chemotaxis protein